MSTSRLKEFIGHAYKRVLIRTHPIWSVLLPRVYRPYSVPGGRIYLDVSESPMMLARALGVYESEKHIAVQKFLPEGGTFLDVGANKGDFSLLAASLVGPCGKVVAFEPVPENSRWICSSIKINGYTNVVVHQIALADYNGQSQLYLGKKSGWHTLKPGRRGQTEASATVMVRRLDDFLEDMEIDGKVHVLKVDVEGAELDMLKGSRRTLEKNKGIVVLLDVHPQLGVRVRDVADFLEALGFSLFAEKPPFTTPVDFASDVRSIVARRI